MAKLNKNEIKIGDVFDSICATNTKILMTGKPVQAICVFLTKEILDGKKEVKIVPIDTKRKLAWQRIIKETAVKKEGILGYIVIYDSRVTMIDRKTGEREVKECCMRTLYTPTEKITSMQWHDGVKLLKNEIIIGREDIFDAYDNWAEKDITL